ncbi:MAG TPA: hypothetical protein PLB45_05030 [Bacilli bacterium]|nr:hypothetical protein [Bacilli bacterium]HPZ24060.1 hypothetical protein [Bacilli bacterium]HQC84209.1 hypothetical protein [Bacilli bacterium]
MSLNNHKKGIILCIIGIILLIVIFAIGYQYKKSRDFSNYTYYFTYEDDNNMVSKSIKIYNMKGELQTEYYIYDEDGTYIGYTKGDKCVVTTSILDVSKVNTITFSFESDENTKLEAIHKG